MKKRILIVCVLVLGVWGIELFSSDVSVEEVRQPYAVATEKQGEEPALYAARALELIVHEPTLTGHQLRSLLQKSRHYQESELMLMTRGESEGEGGVVSQGEWMRSALRNEPVSIEEETAYFHSNRTLFGDRSFEQSRHTIQRLIRIEKVEAKFAL